MFQNYLVTALRTITRHRLYSFINIFGLALGLACIIFVVLFIRDELSWDKWIPGTDNLYRIELTVALPDRPPLELGVVPFPLAATMKDGNPQVSAMTRVYAEGMTLTSGDRQFSERVNLVDSNFLALIPLPMMGGNPATALHQPNSIVLMESAARKFFGSANPIGRLLVTSRGGCAPGDGACQAQTVSLRVTGVISDLPHNSQLTGEALIPNTSLVDRISQGQKEDWNSQNGWGYVRLVPGADPSSVVANMVPLLDRAATPAMRKSGIMRTGSQVYEIHLTPFTKMHLNATSLPPSSTATFYGVVVIGFLILLVACFNFMNLATARASMRGREIALRKTLGARRSQLVIQFLGESVIMALLALILALVAVEMLLPVFGDLLQRPITFPYDDWRFWSIATGVAVFAGIVSGSYPALVLSGFRPGAALRGAGSGRSGSGHLRNVLVVAQFTVSIALGIAALVVLRQIDFARNLDLGFQHGNVVIVAAGNMSPERRDSFAQKLRANPDILAVGQSDFLPFFYGQSPVTARNLGRSGETTLNRIVIDPDYAGVYGIRLVAGRMLSRNHADDRLNSAAPSGDPMNEGRNVLVNVTGAARLGFRPEQAVGKTIWLSGNRVKIAGVLGDTMYLGALSEAAPIVYAYIPSFPLTFSIKLRQGGTDKALSFIDGTWHQFYPASAILRQFIDEGYVKLYSDAERQDKVFEILVGMAILIACLGLYGLAAFNAGRRTREIGIRKTFGARDRDIVLMLLRQFTVPIALANLVAWPLAWYFLSGWLRGFAFRIPLDPLYFVAVSALALLIGWATVISHALRVARANPVRALRHE